MKNCRKSDPKEASASEAVTSAPPTADGHGSLLPTHPSPYDAGEIVIASHGLYFYEAKVEKVEFRKHWSYLIHYRGWKRSWDEWVGTDRLMKATEENLPKLSRPKNHMTDKNMKAAQMPHADLSTSSDASGKGQKNSALHLSHKRKRDQFVFTGKDNGAADKFFNISIPLALRKQLLDDFQSINQMDKLVKLPRTPNVDDILEKYRDSREKKEGVISASSGEVLNGLRDYFNKALPVMLLYNKERQQYQDVVADSLSPSAIYGAEHLLRLFDVKLFHHAHECFAAAVKLPALLYNLSIKDEILRELQQNLQDILKFLQKHQGAYFLSTYHVREA